MYRYKALKRNGRRVDEHRLIAGAENSGVDVVVHHKDENPRNNSPDNLELMSRSDHCKLHGFGTTIRPTQIFKPDDRGYAVCRACKTKLKWEEFRIDRSWLNGRASICRECWNKYRRDRRSH